MRGFGGMQRGAAIRCRIARLIVLIVSRCLSGPFLHFQIHIAS
jgi:hypothetical protein